MMKALLLLLALCLGSAHAALSESDRQIILDTHNSLRGMVNPTASNMQELVQQKF